MAVKPREGWLYGLRVPCIQHLIIIQVLVDLYRELVC